MLVILAVAVAPAAALAAPTWLDPVTLEGAQTSDAPDVAAIGDGNAATVWLADVQSEAKGVLASFRPRGGPWGTPEDLDPAGGVGFERPLVAALPNGRASGASTGASGTAAAPRAAR